MGVSTISLGLGLGGGKSATSSGTSGGGGTPFENLKSVSFDGSDDFVTMSNPADLNFSGDTTISFWVKYTNQASSFNFLIDKSTSAGERQYALYLRNETGGTKTFSFSTSGGTAAINNSTSTISVNQWSHVALVVDSGVTNGTKLYINGSSETLGTHTITTNDSAPFQLGKRYDTSFEFGGLMDEVAIFNSALSSSNITAIYNSGVPNDISSLSPVGWWRMGDGTEAGSGTTIYDMSSNSNNGTLTNGPTYSTDVPLVLPSITNSLSGSFDGSDDYLLMGTSAISLDTNFTISAWFKPTSDALAGYDFMVGWGNDTSGQSRVMQILNSKLSFEIYFSRVSGSTTLSADTWYHGAVTFSGNDVEIFLNGSSDGTGTLSRSSMTSSLTFAGGTPAMTAVGFIPFSGLIDEFAVFDSVLSSTVISAIYNSGVPADISSLSPLGWWRLGDGTGDTDSSGGTPANTDAIGTVVNQGSASNANGTGTNGPTYSNSVPS